MDAIPEAVASLIVSSRLQAVFELGVPWPKESLPTGKDWRNNPKDNQPKWTILCWESLVALTTIDLKDTPNFLSLLPKSSSSEFPVQAVGLLLLLDQAPRHLCTGINERWRNGFFDEMALKLSLQLRDLPSDDRIDNFERWEALGWSYAHWSMISVFLSAPFAHSEDLAIHENILMPIVHEERSKTENYYNTTDAYHAKQLTEGLTMDASSDTAAFSRFIQEGMPDTDEISDMVFWFCRVKEAHVPIIRTFGRYPYRNGALGRESTEKEKEFLVQTKNFGSSVDEVAAKKIKEDADKGVWTPLI